MPVYTVKKKAPVKRSFIGNVIHKIDSVLDNGPKMPVSSPRGTTSPNSMMKVKKKTTPKK
jgi:hypothetical protein